MAPLGERVRVVLVRPRNPLNMGAAARAMSNFGFSKLRVVEPYEAAFREARSAVGASAVLAEAEEYASVAEAVADCTLVVGTTAVGKRAVQHRLRVLAAGARVVRRERDPIALLFGSEKTGLSNEALSHCDWLMRIPAREEHASMNLGQAVAVCLYELVRESPGAAAEKKKQAPAGEVERVTRALLELLRESGYVKTRATEEKVRRLVRRMELSKEDAGVWMGMLRQMGWRMER